MVKPTMRRISLVMMSSSSFGAEQEGESREDWGETIRYGFRIIVDNSCTRTSTLSKVMYRYLKVAEVKYWKRRSRSLGICPAKTKTWGRDHHARDKAVELEPTSAQLRVECFYLLSFILSTYD